MVNLTSFITILTLFEGDSKFFHVLAESCMPETNFLERFLFPLLSPMVAEEYDESADSVQSSWSSPCKPAQTRQDSYHGLWERPSRFTGLNFGKTRRD